MRHLAICAPGLLLPRSYHRALLRRRRQTCKTFAGTLHRHRHSPPSSPSGRPRRCSSRSASLRRHTGNYSTRSFCASRKVSSADFFLFFHCLCRSSSHPSSSVSLFLRRIRFRGICLFLCNGPSFLQTSRPRRDGLTGARTRRARGGDEGGTRALRMGGLGCHLPRHRVAPEYTPDPARGRMPAGTQGRALSRR